MDENRNIDPKLEEALKGIWDSLTDEQKEKANACKTLDELTALAGKEGVELPDEVLDQVAGGCGEPDYFICPKCHHKLYPPYGHLFAGLFPYAQKCVCGYEGTKKSDWIIP